MWGYFPSRSENARENKSKKSSPVSRLPRLRYIIRLAQGSPKKKLLPNYEIHEQTLNGWHKTNNPTFTVRTSVKPH